MLRTTFDPLPPLGIALRHLREQAGWTQTALEAAAGLGPTAVTKLERGVHYLSRSEAERLVRILGYPDGWLDRTLAVIEQFPRWVAVEDSPAALAPAEHLAVESMAFGLSRRIAEAARAEFGNVLRAKRWQADRKAAGKAWQRFRKLPKAEHSALVASEKEFRTWAFCERLCEESYRVASVDATEARRIAELGLLAAQRSTGDHRWRCCLESYALAFVGNALQVLGEFHQASKAFQGSASLLTDTSISILRPLDGTRPKLLFAVFLKYQERYEESLALTEEALSIKPGALQAARLLINKASVLAKTRAYEEALAALEMALPKAEKVGDPRLVRVIEFNQISYLGRIERFSEAANRLENFRPQLLEAGGAIDLIRLRWLEAQLALGLKRMDEAARALGRVWQAFADKALTFDAALAALELAALELERGRLKEVKRLASASGFVFAALTLPGKLLASVNLFWDAVKKEVATVATARHLIEEFRRLEGRTL